MKVVIRKKIYKLQYSDEVNNSYIYILKKSISWFKISQERTTNLYYFASLDNSYGAYDLNTDNIQFLIEYYLKQGYNIYAFTSFIDVVDFIQHYKGGSK